jgi:ribonuclease P protein component
MDLVYKTTSHPPRFAVVVSSKIDKRATHRNRMKRLVREAVRRQLPSIENGVDGVLIVRRRIPDSEQEVEGIMTELLKKAELLNTE